MIDDERLAGPLTQAEADICNAIQDLFKNNPDGPSNFGRSVYLFGHMTSKLIKHSIEQYGDDPHLLLTQYFALFGAGMGIETRQMSEAELAAVTEAETAEAKTLQ